LGEIRIFNKSYHLRTINLKKIQEEFDSFTVLRVVKLGTRIRYYNRLLSKLKHILTPSESWIPLLWTQNGIRNTMCPNCGHHFTIPYKFNLISYMLDLINILISPKRPYQICVLLEINHA